jgi:hypothetical protein
MPPTMEARGEVFPPTVDTQRVAIHFEHLVRTYPPREPGDLYLVELINPDTGQVDMSVHEDREEAFRRLAKPFVEDT